MPKEIKITLIHPPKPKSLRSKERGQWVRPLGLHYMAAVLEKHGFPVTILDFEKDLVDESQRVAILKDSPSDLFGITSVTYTRFQAIAIAREIKKIFPKSVVLVGGVHFQFVAEETLSHINEIDIVCYGEGENVILNVARAITSGKSVEEMYDIPGIVFRRGDKIVRTPPQPLIKNLDEIPFYTNFTWEDYPEYVTVGNGKIRAITIITSRGCPYKCAFCSMGASKYRVRSAGNVLDEIEYFVDRFGLNAVYFFDATFAASPKHVKSLCDEMINRKVNIKWSCGLRADTPLDLLPLMKEAGLVSFTLGVESGSPKILESISKGISLEQVENIIKAAEQLDIEVPCFFMLSHPDETLEDAMETVEFQRKIMKHRNVVVVSSIVTMIFPGTKVEKLAKERGILPQDFSWALPYKSEISDKFAMSENIPLYLERMTPSEIEKIVKLNSFRIFQNASLFFLIRGWAYIVFSKRDFRLLLNYLVRLTRYLIYKVHRRVLV